MANDSKKYVSLTRLSDFLDNIKEKYSQIGHKHKISDLTDYTVDTSLSPTSNNPIANSIVDTEFEAVSQAMEVLENAIDDKLNISDYVVDSELTSSSTNPVQNKAVNDGINLVYDTMFSITDEKADIEHTHTKEDVGLGNVDNTADVEKSVNYATTAGAANSVEWKNVSNKPFSTTVNGTVVLPIVNVEESDDGNGIGRGSTGRFSSAVVSGEEYKVVFDGTEYYCVAYTDPIMNDYIVLGNFTIVEPITGATEHTDTGEPFLICYSIIYKYAGVYTTTIDSHTVEITHVEEVVENIDESCIPDTIARVEDIPSVDGLATEAFVTEVVSDNLTEAKSYADTAATTAANTVRNDLLNGAGGAYDTLKELGDLIDDNKDAIDALETIAAGKADATHSHAISDVTNLQSVLDSKANLTHIHPYGVCSSSATYTTKTVTVDNFSLVEGARVIVKFTNANSASSPKLNVNSTGAIPIMRYGTTAAGSNTTTNGWEAGAVLAFTYDGTNWVQDYWYNTTYTNASLGQGYGTCYTSSSTAEKTVSMSNYEDKTGGIVSIKFTYSVDAGATLNINSQGAMDIYYKGSAIVDDVIKGGDIATFICSGSTYHLISVDRWFEDIAELQANDRRVRQMPTSTNGNFRLLLTPSSQSEDTTAYTYFDSGVYLNPHYNILYGADIDGSATGVKGVTSGNFLVGNDDENMVEKTPAEVLSMINGASIATMTTAEYNALETRNTNTLYMLTDAEEDDIDGLDDMVQINLDNAVEGEANLINAGTLNGKTEDMLSVLRAVDATNAENANNANALEGYSIDSLLDKIYPINSGYTTATPNNPASYLGGTWELVGKEFRDSCGSANDGSLFTVSNCSAHAISYSRSSSMLSVRVGFTNSTDLSDTTVVLGTLNFNRLGISQLPYTIYYAIGTSDGGNVVMMISINHTTGDVAVVDIVGADTMSASSSYVNFTVACNYEHMLDDFCDKFHWKRTA